MSVEITKESLIDILKDLGKEYRKRVGKQMPAEIVMTGGAAVLARYDFRKGSMDVDAIIRAASAMDDAACMVRDKYQLEYEWLNNHFMSTDSYSHKLYEHSDYYRTFANVLTVRTVKPEYLVATKLRAARPYKHDLSDIVGIITEEKERDKAFTEERVLSAYADLYGDCPINEEAKQYMWEAFNTQENKRLIEKIQAKEKEAASIITAFNAQYPKALTKENLSDILAALRKNHAKIQSETAVTDESNLESLTESVDNLSNDTKNDKKGNKKDDGKGKTTTDSFTL